MKVHFFSNWILARLCAMHSAIFTYAQSICVPATTFKIGKCKWCKYGL